MGAEYEALNSLYTYCSIVGQKMSGYELRKTGVFSSFGQKVVMEYRQSSLNTKDYLLLRQKLKNI
jgi:hypothetical protein